MRFSSDDEHSSTRARSSRSLSMARRASVGSSALFTSSASSSASTPGTVPLGSALISPCVTPLSRPNTASRSRTNSCA